MALSSPAGSGSYETSTPPTAAIGGNLLISGWVWWNDAVASTKCFFGGGAVGAPTWYFVVTANNLEFWVRRGAGFTLSKLSLGAGLYPTLQTWSFFFGCTDSAGDTLFGCETPSGWQTSGSSGTAPSAGAPGSNVCLFKVPTFGATICKLANTQIWQLGAAACPSLNVINRIRLSHGRIREIPGLSLESHLPLYGKPGADTSTIVPVDATGKRTWSCGPNPTGNPHVWEDSPIPRMGRGWK